jgi:hypothetical protein
MNVFIAPGSSMLKLSRSETSLTRGPNSQGFCYSFLPEDGRISSFQNVVILLKYSRWTESKKLLLQKKKEFCLFWLM